MTAPRSSSLRALRTLSQQPVAPSARRNLHITGVQSAQPANNGEKALSNHDFLQSRAFSIAMRRINGSAFSEYVPIHSPIPFYTSTHTSVPNLQSNKPKTNELQLLFLPPIQHLPRHQSPERHLNRRLRLHAQHGRPRRRPSATRHPSPGPSRAPLHPMAPNTHRPTHEAPDLHRVRLRR